MMKEERVRTEKEDRLLPLQEAIGYRFADRQLLQTALRHSSYLNEHGLAYTACNERLEYLGDAVLELASSLFLFHTFPEEPEGKLTRMRAAQVCEPALAQAARELQLGHYLQLGKGEEKSGGRTKPSILADAMEALIGALYLDGGFAAAERFIRRYILQEDTKQFDTADPKSCLQEYLQQDGPCQIVYRTRQEESAQPGGFFAEVLLKDRVLGAGKGRSKKEAEQEAARQALHNPLVKAGRQRETGKQACI